MPLFEEHRIRSALYAGGLAITAWIFHWFIPASHFAFSLTSTGVSVLALSSLAILTVAHHTRQGQVLTRSQEEMLLIGAFGLLWMSFLVIYRAFRSGGEHPGTAVGAPAAVGSSGGGSGGKRPDWCTGDSVYCVVEEYRWTRW